MLIERPTLTNLRAAHTVMAYDQGLSTPAAEELWVSVTRPMLLNYTDEQLTAAEAALAAIRAEDDEGDIDSPLWQLCCGDADEWDAATRTAAETGITNELLEEVFGLLG